MRPYVCDNEAEMEDVWRLTHDVYVSAGYCDPQPNGLLRHYPNLDEIAETDVILARNEHGELIGTVSVTVDGPRGLHVDHAFRAEADEARRECAIAGQRLGASWRIVTNPAFRLRTMLLTALIDETFRTAFERRRCDVMLYTFHPRHEGHYRRLCGFYHVAGPRPDPSMGWHPAVLMCGDRIETQYCWRETMRKLSR